MTWSADPRRVEHLLDDGDDVVALVAATPDGALPATIGEVVARSLGLRRRRSARLRRWDRTADAYLAPGPTSDLGSRRQLLLALTGSSDRLVVVGVDRLGRPVEVVCAIPVASLERVAIEPARMMGVDTDALVIVAAGVDWRLVLARPHRRDGRQLAALLGAGLRYSDG